MSQFHGTIRTILHPLWGGAKIRKGRKEMKKLLIALLLVLSCVLLFACVQSGPVTDTTAPSDESTPNATDAPTEAPSDTPTEAPTDEVTFFSLGVLTLQT